MKKRTAYLIEQFLNHSLSEAEEQELIQWVKDPNNRNLLKKEVQLNYILNAYFNQNDGDLSYAQIKNRVQVKKGKVRSLSMGIKYVAAAILVGVLATTYIFRDNIFVGVKPATPIIVNNKIQPGTDKATLTLEDGSLVTLEKGTNYQNQNVNSNGEEIIYDATEQNSNKVAFNILTIPRGGEFFVKLSDGTQVWLNSESQLKYPLCFKEGETRQVELVYGEAYFEVSKSTEHDGASFKVLHNLQEVQVLGTEFNIKAYKDESNVYTTLAEGKVAVYYKEKTKNLLPGQQSNLNVQANSLTVSKVNVANEISWKEGVFKFTDNSLKEIMKVLSRWYDMEVIFENKEIEKVRFKGILGKDQSIEEILSAIKSVSINNYEINNKTIILR